MQKGEKAVDKGLTNQNKTGKSVLAGEIVCGCPLSTQCERGQIMRNQYWKCVAIYVCWMLELFVGFCAPAWAQAGYSLAASGPSELWQVAQRLGGRGSMRGL